MKKIIPFSIRHFLWTLKPEIFGLNTLILEDIKTINDLVQVPERYRIKKITLDDWGKLKKFYDYSGPTAFDRKVPKRLNSTNCTGFAFIDIITGNIIYNSWLIFHYSSYLEEYNIKNSESIAFWESVFCLPEHRHKGLHTRMEQEAINYAVGIGAKKFCMQFHKSNVKGNKFALSRGYTFMSSRLAISWPFFDVYRSLYSFLNNPFKRIKI